MGLSKDGKFFLGKRYDTEQKKLTDDQILYDPDDLTTHAVVTGMTGSGKTGLCVGILEEAALEGIPAIIIDPKGDLTNLLLHFPDLAPGDFQPWVDPEAARRDGKTVDQFAAETAENWKTGLAGWGLGSEQLQELKDSVDFGLYTPGSTVGSPVNVLSSFAAPDLEWEANREILREKISTIVSALLGLVGLTDIDPLRSREHILLSNVIENAWSTGVSLDLTELILQTQKPPFERLGAFPVDNFFPEKDRFQLAMLLNNFLASPSFEVWREGQVLDIAALLYSPSGRPRHSIFYIAHLNDSERMFFVTLLFASIESWMRSQRGTSGLRALVYMDEILGFLPPVANPPSRPIMLRMLKQARAFGVGLLLATQNPVDVDYKGLSNAGTWLIGRLQTDQDKQRLLDGLDSAGGGLERRAADSIISALGKRTFLLHNVNSKGPQIFQTRWALNYLAGPMMRSQIPALMKLTGQSTPLSQPQSTHAAGDPRAAAALSAADAPGKVSSPFTNSRPAVPGGAVEYFIPNDLPYGAALKAAGIPADAKVEQNGYVYRAAILAQAEVNYLARKYNLQLKRSIASLPTEPRGQKIMWEDFPWSSYAPQEISAGPLPGAQYAAMPAWINDARQLKTMETDFIDWVLRTGTINVYANDKLKVFAGPETSPESFRQLCSEAANSQMKTSLDKVNATYEKKIADLNVKIKKQEREVDQQESELSSRRLEEAGNVGEMVLGLFGGRKKSINSALSKRRMTSSAKTDLQQEKDDLKAMQVQLKDLEEQFQAAIKSVEDEWADIANTVAEVPVTPYRKDIFVSALGIAWLPYYRLTVDGKSTELPAFKSAD